MSTFAFRAVDLAGVPARGEMEASSKTVVSEQLRQRGLIVLDISEKREAMKLESIFQRFKSVNLRALAVFSRQFATLIASGMPMLRSLYTLEAQTEDEMLEKAIIGVREDVEAGSSVAQAMESQPGVFDPLYRSVVRAGEDSGRLEEALDRIAYQLERLDALRRQVRSAMTYPAVVFGLALVVMIVVVAVIVPVFVNIFNEIAADNPDRGHQPAADDADHGGASRTSSPTSWYLLIAGTRGGDLRLPALEEDRPRTPPVGPPEAPHSADRRRGPEGGAGALVAHLLGDDRLRRPDPPGDRDRRRDFRERGGRGGDGRRLRFGQARRDDRPPDRPARDLPADGRAHGLRRRGVGSARDHARARSPTSTRPRWTPRSSRSPP